MKKYILFAIMIACTLFAKGAGDKENTLLTSYNYLRGIEAKAEGNHEKALTFFGKEVEEHKENGYAYYEIAQILEDREEIGPALSCTNKAIKYIPKKDKESIGEAYMLRMMIYLSMQDTLKAYQDVESYIKLKPKDVTGYLAKAKLHMDENKIKQAEGMLTKAMSVDESSFLPYLLMGELYNRQERWTEARNYLNKAIVLGPNNEYGYVQRAITYLGTMDYNAAAEDIASGLSLSSNDNSFSLMLVCMISGESFMAMEAKLKAMTLMDPRNSLMLYYLGALYHETGQYMNAVNYFTKSYELDNDAYVATLIAGCYNELGMQKTALRYIELAEDEDSTDTNVIRQKADIAYYDGRTEDAIREYTRCIELEPGYYYDYYRRAFYEDNACQTEKAIEDYTSCILLEPDFAYAYLGRGDQYMKTGLKELALKDYRKVVELDTIPSQDAAALFAYYELGEKENAIAFCDSCLAKFPNDAGLYYDAACLWARIGDYRKSIHYLYDAYEKGYIHYHHIEKDDDLEPLRILPEYQELMDKYKGCIQEDTSDPETESIEETYEIPFTKNGGNTCNVKCTINGLPLNFIFDTGASDISLSQVEATFMMKNGYLSSNDVIGSSYYTDANGNVSEGTNIILKNVDFGGLKLSNVKASVVMNQKAPLLLGQSVLGKLGKIEIDNSKNTLIIKQKRTIENRTIYNGKDRTE